MKNLSNYFRRVLFLGAFVFAGVAVAEKALNFIGYSLISDHYSPWRLLEVAAIGLLFVIVLQLREINLALTSNAPHKEP
jgi:hypothetical protein